jgi:hypothetical protein
MSRIIGDDSRCRALFRAWTRPLVEAIIVTLSALGFLCGSVAPAVAVDYCKLPDLDGIWIDEGTKEEVRINTEKPAPTNLLGQISLGTPKVTAMYVKVHTCKYPDSSGTKPRLQTDFEGHLTYNANSQELHIKGTLHMCMHKDGKHINYWDANDLDLRVVNENKLDGFFHDYQATERTDISFTRKPKTEAGAEYTWPCPWDPDDPPEKPTPWEWVRGVGPRLIQSEWQKAHPR